MTATSVHIGIDLAWGLKNRTGLAAVGADGRLLASASATTDDEIIDWVTTYKHRLGVVAIDAPLIVVNTTGQRECETLISRAFGRFDAGPHSTNLGKPAFNPPRGATLAGRLGLALDPGGERDRVAIEVYPHPAMVGLWQLDLAIKYKSKHAFDLRKREFRRLLDFIKSEPSLRVAELPRWGELRSIAAAASKHGDLNRIEDEVDGIVCAWLASLWATTDARLQVYGDVASGYIVAPPKPSHEARPQAERIGPTRRMQLAGDDAPTPRPIPISAGGAIATSAAFLLDGPTGRHTLTPDEARLLEAALARHRAN